MASGWLQNTVVPLIRCMVKQSPNRRAYASTVVSGRRASRRLWTSAGLRGPGGRSAGAGSSCSCRRSASMRTSFRRAAGDHSAWLQALVDDLLEHRHQLGVRVLLLTRQRGAGHEEHVGGALGVDLPEGPLANTVADHGR